MQDADGYYGDDSVVNDDIDVSFLDDEQSK